MIIKYKHVRRPESGRVFTVAGVLNEQTNVMTFGISVCRKGDNFSRKEGRNKAEERANNGEDIIHSQVVSPEHLPKLGRVFLHVADLLVDAKEHKIEARLEASKRLKYQRKKLINA